MIHLRIFLWLRTLGFLGVLGLALALGGILFWVQHTGLPESWRRRIEQELQTQTGITAQVGELRYSFLRGIIARDVQVYTDTTRTHSLAHVEKIVVDIDRTKILRGITKVTNLELMDAKVDMPIDPDDPNSKHITMEKVSGKVLKGRGRSIEVRDGRGQIAGIDVTLNGRVLGYRPIPDAKEQDQTAAIKARRVMLNSILQEWETWTFNAKQPPRIRITVEGDLAQSSTIDLQFEVSANSISKNSHVVEEFKAQGEFSHGVIRVPKLTLRDSSGQIDGSVAFHPDAREGCFQGAVDLNAPRLLQSLFGLETPRTVTFASPPQIEAEGTFSLPRDQPVAVHLTGHAKGKGIQVQNQTFDSYEGSFSIDNKSFFVRDLKIRKGAGELKGKVLLRDRVVRVAINSTMPVAVCRPFFENGTLGKILNDIDETRDSKVRAQLEIQHNLDNPTLWSVTGEAEGFNVRYRGISLDHAKTSLDLNNHKLSFDNAELAFDYTDYPLRKVHDGPRKGSGRAKQILYDRDSKLLYLRQIHATAYPGPLVKMFHRGIGESLEIYGFHAPPELIGDGPIDLVKGGTRTNLKIDLKTDSNANYPFLGKPLVLEKPTATVQVLTGRVDVRNLNCEIFGGKAQLDLKVLPRDGGPNVSGELVWNDFELNKISEAYGFTQKSGGILTGRIEFSTPDGKAATLDGNGNVALTGGELFSVPMFGPLSPLIGGIIGEKAGFQHARDASCTFRIRDGKLTTRDFRTFTSSLTFTGNADVDLDKRTLDMTMRMNAKGLLGVITLPLRPFYGLFQFRGQGPIAKPEWENVMFTSPPKDENEDLEAPPKAKVVNE